jgi:hypothetical protein
MVGQLIVSGQPLLIPGGELGNSSAGTAAQADIIVPKLAVRRVNTILMSVAWEQIEPKEGNLDFSILDHWIAISQQQKRRSGRSSLARFHLCVAPSGGGSLRVGYDIDPFRVRRGLGVVVVVPVPPLVRRGLGVTLWRVLPSLLTAEWCDVEIAPRRPHRLVAAAVDEVCAEHPVTVAEEHIVAVPFIDAEVLVEAVDHGVPGHLPAHPRFHASDVHLRRA